MVSLLFIYLLRFLLLVFFSLSLFFSSRVGNFLFIITDETECNVLFVDGGCGGCGGVVMVVGSVYKAADFRLRLAGN